MGTSLTIIPDERLAALRPLLEAQLRTAAVDAADPGDNSILDPMMRRLLIDCFDRIGADEGTVWLLDGAREALVPRFNSGPSAEQFVGKFRQSLRSGLISMVLGLEQPFCENEIQKNAQQDRTLDEQLAVQTCAMIAVPLAFGGETRGVVSCVQLREPGSSRPAAPGFSAEHLEAVQFTVHLLARLIEARLLNLCLGRADVA